MNTLTQLRNNLQRAEEEYRTANGSLDSSPLDVIVCKEALHQARFNWLKGCEEYALENHLFYEEEV